jgi:hypothetical protein
VHQRVEHVVEIGAFSVEYSAGSVGQFKAIVRRIVDDAHAVEDAQHSEQGVLTVSGLVVRMTGPVRSRQSWSRIPAS